MGLLKKGRRPLRMSAPRVGCPFCWEWLPPPKSQWKVFSGEGCRGGQCKCGVFFVLDEIGRGGGQALLDALALACDGDLDRALKLESGKDYQVKTKPLKETRATTGPSKGRASPQAGPKVWAVKLEE